MQWLKTWLRGWLGVTSDLESQEYVLNTLRKEIADVSRVCARCEDHIANLNKWSRQVDSDHAKVDALRQLIAATGKNFTLRLEDISRRVIDLETEPEAVKPSRTDDDPLTGRGSFAATVAEIERANGIR